mgnify:CR=1 FL=1
MRSHRGISMAHSAHGRVVLLLYDKDKGVLSYAAAVWVGGGGGMLLDAGCLLWPGGGGGGEGRGERKAEYRLVLVGGRQIT